MIGFNFVLGIIALIGVVILNMCLFEMSEKIDEIQVALKVVTDEINEVKQENEQRRKKAANARKSSSKRRH